MSQSGALHACRGNHEMAVDGLAGVSKGPKPSSSVGPCRTGYTVAITIRSLPHLAMTHEAARDGH